MAEVIGIVAAAVQFADVGAKIAIGLSRLCSDLQHAPSKIKAANREVKQLLDLIDMLKIDDLSSGGLVPAPHIDKAISLLTESTDQAKALENLLVQLLPGPSDSRIKKGWRTIVTLKKEEEILDKCRHLEALKNSLNVWYNHENMLLLKQHMLTTATIETSTQTLNQFVLPLNGKITSVGDQVQATDKFFQETGTRIEAGIKSIDNHSVHISGELALVRDGINTINTATQYESHAIRSSLSAIGNELSLLRQHMAVHGQPFIQQPREDYDRMVSHLISKPSFMSDLVANHSLYDTLLAERRARLNRRSQPTCLTTCTCAMRRSRRHINGPSSHLFFSNVQEHESDCPRYRQSRRSRTVGIRVILPRLFAKSIQVAFTATSGAGGFALSPYFALTGIVDRSKSPAFVAFDDAWTELGNYFGLGENCRHPAERYHAFFEPSWLPDRSSSKGKSVLEAIYNSLALQLNAGRASALDQDESGTTLLNISQEVVYVTLLLDRFRGDLSEVSARLIKLLVDHGADINAQTLSMPNALSDVLFAKRLAIALRWRCAGRSEIDQTLTQYGAEWTDTELRHVGNIPWHVLSFIRNPDLAIDYGCSQLCLAVCQRSQAELKRLIACGHDVNSLTRGYTPLCFAIGWPSGMEILLDAGADSLIATHCAVAYSDEAALAMLLKHEAKLVISEEDLSCMKWLSRMGGLSLLHYALQVGSSDNVIAQLARAAAAKRRQLADLAQRHLSHEELEVLGTNVAENRDAVLDAGAELVAIALKEEGVHVPLQIWPGNQTTIYHDDCMTVQAADELYACGFHDVDTMDTGGCTPFLLACREMKWDLISWYLDKGASAVDFGLSGFQNGLQVVAQSLEYQLNFAGFQDRGLEDNSTLSRLGSLCSQILTDDCTCCCSTYGCIPITMLIRKHKLCSGGKDIHVVGAWLRACKVALSIEEVCYAEACRLMVFERLGMAHTCCSTEGEQDSSVCYWRTFKVIRKSVEEIMELQEEDAVSKSILDMYMKLYQELRKEHTGPISEFWTAWLESISERLPAIEYEYSPELGGYVEVRNETEATRDNTGFEPDEEAIRSKIRSLLHYSTAEDPADILSDSKWILSDAGTPGITSEILSNIDRIATSPYSGLMTHMRYHAAA